MAEQNWNPTTRRFYTPGQGRSVSHRGAEAGKDEKYDAVREQGWRDEYAKSQGATGLGGARKRSSDAYKSGEAEHLRKRRAEAEARRKAAQRAADEDQKDAISPEIGSTRKAKLDLLDEEE